MAVFVAPPSRADESTITQSGSGVLSVKQVLLPIFEAVGGTAGATLGAGTHYIGGSGDPDSDEGKHQGVCPRTITIYGFTFRSTLAVGAGRTLTVRLRKNGVNFADSLTLTAGQTTGSVILTLGGQQFDAGDLWSYSLTGDGASTLAAGYDASATTLWSYGL